MAVRSQVQKLIAIFCIRQKAGLASAEDTVAIAGDYLVSPVTKPFGDDPQCGRNQRPRSTDLSQHGDDGIRTQRKAFLGQAAVFDEVHRIQIVGIECVTLQHVGRETALQRGEAQAMIHITLQAELHQAVAESAHAIV